MQASASVTPSGDSKAAIGEALKQALSGNRLQSISLHDERGDVLWLDEGALGPDEHNLVLDAVSALNAATDKSVHFVNIGDGRAAAFLPARSPLNDLLGIAMIIADAKFLDAKGAAKFVTPTSTNLMRRLAFLRRPPSAAPAAPPPAPAATPAAPAAGPTAAKVVSQPARPPMAARPGTPPAARPAAPASNQPPNQAARPAAPPAQRPGAPAAKAPAAPARPAAPAAQRPAGAPPVAPRPAAPPAQAKAPARPAAPAQKAAPAARADAQPQRMSGSVESDSIAFEISDIDPRALLKPTRGATAEAKRPDLRVVQTDRLPKLNVKPEDEIIPELIQDEPPSVDEILEAVGEVSSEEPTTEVEALAEPDFEAALSGETGEPEGDMTVAPEFVEEEPQLEVGVGQFEFYGQIFELHAQQLVKLKGSGGTRRYEVLVRDAHADNEFGVAPDRVLQDVHDPSANSDLDRIVVEQLVAWMGEHRAVWEGEPASFSVNVGMGTIADPKFASFVATTLKSHKVPSKALGFEISEKSCVEQVRDVDMFVQACEKIGCHVVLDDFTMHHNALRWLGSPALKFLKLDPKISAVAMKEKVAQALVVAITQASKVLGLSCVAKRVDTPAVRDWLSAVGLDYAQGFLLDQPRSLVKLAAEKQK
jgi:EAL domain-containing protein (putative c-di-GMP-specific phosphodiesterase class I)